MHSSICHLALSLRLTLPPKGRTAQFVIATQVWEGRLVAVKELVMGDKQKVRDEVAFAREVAAITRSSSLLS
eukprot:3627380-Amphidinium_carterae.1